MAGVLTCGSGGCVSTCGTGAVTVGFTGGVGSVTRKAWPKKCQPRYSTATVATFRQCVFWGAGMESTTWVHLRRNTGNRLTWSAANDGLGRGAAFAGVGPAVFPSPAPAPYSVSKTGGELAC